MPSLTEAPMTLGDAKATILRPVGRTSDTDALVAAGEIIRDVFDEMLAMRDWRWWDTNTTKAISANATTFELPSLFKKFYSVQPVSPAGPPLVQLDKREYGRLNPNSQAYGGLCVYIPYNTHSTGVVEVRDAPASTVTVDVNYSQLITCPTSNSSTFAGVPRLVMSYVLAEGRTRVIADYGGGESALQKWESVSQAALKRLVRLDEVRPDKDQSTKSLREVLVGNADLDWGNNDG